MHSVCAYLCHFSKFDGIRDSKRLAFRSKDVDTSTVLPLHHSPLLEAQGGERLHNDQIIANCIFESSPKWPPRYFIYYPNDLRRWILASA
jgi:hypothetical protein